MTDCSSLQNEPSFLKQFGRGQFLLALCKKIWILALTGRRVDDAAQDRVDWGDKRVRTIFAGRAVGQIRRPRGGQPSSGRGRV